MSSFGPALMRGHTVARFFVLVFLGICVTWGDTVRLARASTDPVGQRGKNAISSPPLPHAADGIYPSLEYLNQWVPASPLSSASRINYTAVERGAVQPVETTETSACAARSGCPRAAMVWASGSFTFTELLTAASFTTDANLELKLSLCCNYKFHGAMLRDADLYDRFLTDLLQASPFQVLTLAEKRKMLPQHKAMIVDTGHHRVYTGRTPAGERHSGNDGDGDILILYSGNVGTEGVARVQFEAGLVPTALAKGSESEAANQHAPLTSTDVQLKVSNRVLKCKCPHTLLVQPLLHIGRDSLPPLAILGLGAHCGVRPQHRPVTPHRHVVRLSPGRREDTPENGISAVVDQAFVYATTFAVSPPVAPASQVTWTVKRGTTVVLEHTRLLPPRQDPETGDLLLSAAESPYVEVEPNVLYRVHVRVTRGPDVGREATGNFTLRLPFNRPWPVPPVASAPHFGVVRRFSLSNSTLLAHRAVLAAALDPLRSDFYGYWANAPLDDQPLPQHRISRRHHPLQSPSVGIPTFLGRNLFAYWLSDAEAVCDPVELEGREVWALHSVFTTSPSPATACGERSTVEALAVRRLITTMRKQERFLINVPGTAWSEAEAAVNGIPLDGAEGQFHCTMRPPLPLQNRAAVTFEPKPCVVEPSPSAVGMSGTEASLRIPHRGVYDVQWALVIEVRDAALLDPENMDPTITSTAAAPGPIATGAAHFVTILSRTHHIVRRIASYHNEMTLQLPMHARTWEVMPPQPTTTTTAVVGQGPPKDVLSDAPAGRWVVRRPFRAHSIDEKLRLVLDTSAVPNTQVTLPNGTLQFVAQDVGEELQALYSLPYHARCPDQTVVYVVTVVAMAAPPVDPSVVSVYTEQSCVALEPPREVRKDEVLAWRVLPCPAAERPPYIVERVVAEPLPEGDGSMGDAHHGDDRELLSRTAVTPLVLACGIEVYRRCDVQWTATNLVGTVERTYSLRRCQRPPHLLFHADGNPRKVYQPLPELAVSEDGRTRGGEGTADRPWGYRSVIPIAGYEKAIGYSYNYTGPQTHFESSVHLVPKSSASQASVASALFNLQARSHAPIDPIAWRSREGLEMNFASATYPPAGGETVQHRDFWNSYHHGDEPHGATEEAVGEQPELVAQAAKEAREALARDAAVDLAIDTYFRLTHDAPNARRLRVEHTANASMHYFNYTVRVSRHAPNEAAAEDRSEFVRRGLCVAQTGSAAILAINPRSTVREDERFSIRGPLPPPPAPAVAVLPFCSPEYIFSRHPHLHSVYGYDFTWDCEEVSVIRPTRLDATRSRLTFVAETAARPAIHPNATNCRLTVRNRITDTVRADWFLVRRVFPTSLPFTRFIIGSENAAEEGVAAATPPPRASPPSAQKPKIVPKMTANDANAFPASRIRRIYGKSVVLHVDSPSSAREAHWSVTSFVPEVASSAGTQAAMAQVRFVPLLQHPVAVARGRGGSTVLVKGLDTPGLYTVTHTVPDPAYPHICPRASLTETLQVLHARVKQRELVVCGGIAHLQADPVPPEVRGSFVGRWEVVSLQTAEDEVWTSGANFTGIRFDHGRQADTLVRGLPFGVITFRWAIYRILQGGSRSSTGKSVVGDAVKAVSKSEVNAANSAFKSQLVLVDYDTVRVLVLTENLRGHRLVTLDDTVEVLTTSSTVDWTVVRDGPAGQQVRLSTEPLLNFTSAFGAAYYEDPSFLPYYGPLPRLGTGLMTLTELPTGTVRLHYRLQPSKHVFGPMVGHTCVLHGEFEVERVSAFLVAESAMQHECDGYTGRGRLTLCLHAKATSTGHQKAGSTRSGDSVPMSVKDSAWESRLRLAPLDTLEATIKDGAYRLEEQGCSTPWWAWRSTVWASLTPVDRPRLPAGRCVTFAVTAGRHLAPREASHPLFAAVRGSSVDAQDAQEGSSSSSRASVTSASTAASACRRGDFVPSEIIDGVSAPSAAHVGGDEADGGGLFARLQQYAGGRRRDREGAATRRYLPILDMATLRRPVQALRPLVGLQGLPDERTTEVDLSAVDGGGGSRATVTMRLDLSQPSRLGGYVAYTATTPDHELPRRPVEPGDLAPPLAGKQSLLLSCANGTVRAGDVLAYWHEVNRPDGAVDVTVLEWRKYVEAVQDVDIPCEVLFQSLQHMVTRTGEDDTTQRRRTPPRPASEQPLVPLEVIEQQLESVQRVYRWTKDGIDVTGLQPNLQDALNRRRITKRQLHTISEARRTRDEQEVAREQQQRGRELAHVPTVTTRTERLLAALRRVTTTGEVTAIRVVLPTYEPFSVPYNLLLRTALHKDVICGTSLRGSPPAAQNPYALVTYGRMSIEDVAPAVAFFPQTLKQCEVEGNIPVITINVTGAVFASNVFSADQVVLEEIPNPDLPPRHRVAVDQPGVGLRPCIPQLRQGMQAVVATGTRRHLYIQLGACPGLQMIAPEEYNEYQDSEELLQRLRYPRILRVTINGALHPDSFTKHRDIQVMVAVRPTMARLHLRHHASGSRATALTFPAKSHRPLLLCEGDMRRNGFELGIELIGDQWTPSVGDTGAQDPSSALPHDRASGGGGKGRRRLSQPQHPGHAIAAPGTISEPPVVDRRSPPDVALLNSFSVVEHHGLDSTHHLYLKGGGVYRSHFVNYLFTTILGHAQTWRSHPLVRRYNSTFVSVEVPPQSLRAAASARVVGDAEDVWDTLYSVNDDVGDDGELAEVLALQAVMSGKDSSQELPLLPAVRRFSKVEEILFAVPGIATECHGCLLADVTFYLAGDLTGRWQLTQQQQQPIPPQPPLRSLAHPLIVPWHSAEVIPTVWDMEWLCPRAARQALQRLQALWQVHTGSAAVTLHAEVVIYILRDAMGRSIPATQRPTTLLVSAPVPLSAALYLPRRVNGGRLLTTDNDGEALEPLTLNMNETNRQAAYTTLAADLLRYRRPQARSVHPSFDYHRNDRYLQGRLAVNASVVLKVCAPTTSAQRARIGTAQQCMVVSITDTLIVVEPPARPASTSLLGRYTGWTLSSGWASDEERDSGKAFFSLRAVAHHAALAVLLHAVMPTLGLLQTLGFQPTREGGQDPDRRHILAARDEENRAGVAAVVFVLLWFAHAYAPIVWVAVWLALWSMVLYKTGRAPYVLLFVLSVVYWRYAMV